MARIGVFVCHCGENIGRTVLADRVADYARRLPGTVFSADYPYICSAPGQKILADAIEKPAEIDVDRAKEAAERARQRLAGRLEPEFDAARAEAALKRALMRMRLGHHQETSHPG